jgi:capsular exopolysaccharide synthesis family protein
LRRASAAFRRHLWRALGCTVAGAVAAILITLASVPTYVGQATVQVKSQDAVDVDILRSRALAQRVIDRLQLADDPLLDAPPRSALVAASIARVRRFFGWEEPGAEARGAERVDRFVAAIDTRRRAGTALVEIEFASPSPALAADVANALAEEFVSLAVGQLVDTTQRGRAALERQLEVTTTARKTAEERLESFVRTNQVIPADPRESMEYKKLGDLNEALTRAQSRRIEKEALHRQATTSNGAVLPQLAANPVVTSLTTEIAKLEAERVRVGEGSAEGKRLASQLDTLRTQLKTAQLALVDTLRADFEAAQKQEGLLAQALDAQKAVIAELNQRAIDFEVLKRTVESDRDLERRLKEQVDATSAGAAPGAIALVERAHVPYHADRPRPFQNLGIGVLLGALAGLLLVFFEERLDDSLRTPAHSERELGLPVLGCLPVVRMKRTNGKTMEIAPEVIAGEEPRCIGTEAVRGLRSALFLAHPGGPPQRLLVTSPRPREGKTCVAANLAIVLAQMGRRVVLVDCDFRRPRLHRIFGHDSRVGATSFLTGTVDLPPLVRPTDYGPSLLASGPLPSDPLALIDSAAMAALLDELSRGYDFVVIDAPPALGLPDVPLLARLVGGVLLVVRTVDTPRAAALAATDELRRVRANILGVVMNQADMATLGYLGSTYASYAENRGGQRRDTPLIE